MKHMIKVTWIVLIGVVSVLYPCSSEAARKSKKSKGGPQTEETRMEYKANDMLTRGIELINQKQEERGLKLVKSVSANFPKSKTRFKAYNVLGKYYFGKRKYNLAVKQYQMAAQSEDKEQQAEAFYRVGICYYQLNSFDRAFVTLRKVTTEYPWSICANEAYYYIGICHFKLGRWARAVESLKMVGTSVKTNLEEKVLAEAGHRLFVKVVDEDLIVLTDEKKKFGVQLDASSGDKEDLPMELFSKDGIRYMGSIPTKPGDPKPGDGILQFKGGDTVKVSYLDSNTESGERNQVLLADIRLVSTASAGFTDGAYREYTKGVFGDQQCFVRVKDLDGDVSAERDTLSVRVYTQYKVKKKIDYDKKGVQLEDEEEEIRKRVAIEISLTETEPHSGVFVNSTYVKIALDEKDVVSDNTTLWAMTNDEIVLEYEDIRHIGGDERRVVNYKAKILVGEIQDVKIEHRIVESLDLKARKDLIEAKIFLKLGNIFKEVGLKKQAYAKAEEGLNRIESVIRTSLKSSLDREIVEEAFNVKWDLLMVQDKLRQAIAVCNTLIKLFPDSTLVDKALMKVAKVKLSEGEKSSRDAMNILNGILRLRKSDLKPEAQFIIAEAAEKSAIEAAQKRKQKPDLSRAMMAYKKCAENYPESLYAGQALDKIANYYIKTKDYRRAVEMMEQVFQDYPDASFLDNMLFKWGVAAYRLGELQVAKEKMNQIVNEYPSSKMAGKAKKVLKIVERKLGG